MAEGEILTQDKENWRKKMIMQTKDRKKCNACFKEGKEINAEYFCLQCEEYLR